MRENPETSLAVLKVLADDPSYPVHTNSVSAIREALAYEYAREPEVTASVVYLEQRGLVRAKVEHRPLLSGPAMVSVTVYGLSARGQEYLRNAEADDGKWWQHTKALLKDAGREVTTGAMEGAMEMALKMVAGG